MADRWTRPQAENKWISDGCVIRINYENSQSLDLCIYVFYCVHSIINRSIIGLKSEGVTLISFHRIPIEINKHHLSSMRSINKARFLCHKFP